ncbi:hypothetical protein [Streptacidiphilus sp. EB103A]|uniref:hypothetical protein n=1 Tax=Streptacidiphilus sp. EB103A TaxID=3156275 RepID=UPI0035183EF4
MRSSPACQRPDTSVSADGIAVRRGRLTSPLLVRAADGLRVPAPIRSSYAPRGPTTDAANRDADPGSICGSRSGCPMLYSLPSRAVVRIGGSAPMSISRCSSGASSAGSARPAHSGTLSFCSRGLAVSASRVLGSSTLATTPAAGASPRRTSNPCRRASEPTTK